MSPSHRIRRFLGAHRAFCVHTALALVIVLVALLAGVIAPMSPYEANLAEAFQGPSAQHWFGTDKLGRDMASRVIHGTRWPPRSSSSSSSPSSARCSASSPATRAASSTRSSCGSPT